ncbi:MAG TPA: hypothetical protein VEZ42_15585 [Pseudonocardia sp.]|nr:hypothetical protein [Pseudonocardia sp.]
MSRRHLLLTLAALGVLALVTAGCYFGIRALIDAASSGPSAVAAGTAAVATPQPVAEIAVASDAGAASPGSMGMALVAFGAVLVLGVAIWAGREVSTPRSASEPAGRRRFPRGNLAR